MRIIEIRNEKEAYQELRRIGCDDMGIRIMIPKAVFRAVKIHGVSAKAANIIKQEMLSKGGEAALRREAVTGEGETDVLLLGTERQYRRLIKKLRLQPFGLKRLADQLALLLRLAEDEEPRTLELPDGRKLVVGERPLVMGILNVTPDSFSDGGRYMDVERALERAEEMVEEGADIIDLGGYSTRPGATHVDQKEEMDRVLPVLRKLRRVYSGPVSLDTFNARVAEEGLKEGADIINDTGGLQADPEMKEVVARYGCPVVIMHNRLGGGYRDLLREVWEDLKAALLLAQESGISKEKVILDPGIGFGKTFEENLTLIKRLSEFKSLGCPLLIGASRKSFIGKTLGLTVEERMEGSLAAAIVALTQGASIFRVHDVKATRRALDMAWAILKEG